MTDARHALLAGLGGDLREVLERIPEHFILTAAAVAEGTDHEAVLAALCDLLAASTAHLRRRADEAEAQLAAARRSHLALVPQLAAVCITTTDKGV
jgi:hypothetical protein